MKDYEMPEVKVPGESESLREVETHHSCLLGSTMKVSQDIPDGCAMLESHRIKRKVEPPGLPAPDRSILGLCLSKLP